MNGLILVILSVGLIGMVCLPLLLGHYKQKRKSNLLKERLKVESEASHLKASDFHTWREAYCIGLDQRNNQLLFLNSHETNRPFQKIELGAFRLCRPIRDFREVRNGKETKRIIKKISLVLDYYDDHRKPYSIELYDEDKTDYIINEWELAQEWSKKINELKS